MLTGRIDFREKGFQKFFLFLVSKLDDPLVAVFISVCWNCPFLDMGEILLNHFIEIFRNELNWQFKEIVQKMKIFPTVDAEIEVP